MKRKVQFTEDQKKVILKLVEDAYLCAFSEGLNTKRNKFEKFPRILALADKKNLSTVTLSSHLKIVEEYLKEQPTKV